MRVLVVLVLTLFVGCNVKPSHADQPTPKLDELNRTIKRIERSIIRILGTSIEHIMTKTEPGIYWSARREELIQQGEQYLDSAWEQIPQETKDSIRGVIHGTLYVLKRVDDEMKQFKREFEPIFDAAARVAEGITNELTDEVELVKNFASSMELHVQEYLATLESSVTPQQ